VVVGDKGGRKTFRVGTDQQWRGRLGLGLESIKMIIKNRNSFNKL
jgi:hypothetical protein